MTILVFFGIYKGQFWGVSSMSSSFQNLVAGTLLATTTFCGVTSPMEAKATHSPGEDWVYMTNPETQPCVPQFSVSDNVVDNTIRIQVADGNTCPVSGNLFIFIQDDRPQPLRLKAVYRHNSWIANIVDARPGIYRVMGISPTPAGIGDDEYISARHLGIDQVITIRSVAQATLQPHPVAPPPPVEAEQPQQNQVQSQDQWFSIDLRSLFDCLFTILKRK